MLAADPHSPRDRALKLRASKMWGQRPQDVRAERWQRPVERVEHPMGRQGRQILGEDTEDRRLVAHSGLPDRLTERLRLPQAVQRHECRRAVADFANPAGASDRLLEG